MADRLFAIWRVTRRGKPVRAPELMHSGLRAPNAATALLRYAAENIWADKKDLEAREVRG